MPEEVEIITAAGAAYRARIRLGTASDRRTIVQSWVPVLDRGPSHWLDRDWPWETFGDGDLHIDLSPEWLVIADEIEAEPSGEIFGVLVTTGPTTARQAGIGELPGMAGESMLWVEYIAIAPTIRLPDCSLLDRRKTHVKAVGPQLMRAAIARSGALGAGGRIGLHAEGDGARETYTKRWDMRDLGEATHRAGGAYPVCFGDAAWAAKFCSGLSRSGRR